MSLNGNLKPHGLQVRPIAGRIGAEVGGLQLSGELDSSSIDAIRHALRLVYNAHSRHLVSSCRYVFNYAMAYREFGDPQHLEYARHGLQFLRDGRARVAERSGHDVEVAGHGSITGVQAPPPPR